MFTGISGSWVRNASKWSSAHRRACCLNGARVARRRSSRTRSTYSPSLFRRSVMVIDRLSIVVGGRPIIAMIFGPNTLNNSIRLSSPTQRGITAPLRQCAALKRPRSSDFSSVSQESTSSAMRVGRYVLTSLKRTAAVRLDTMTGRGTMPLISVAAVVLPHSGVGDVNNSIAIRSRPSTANAETDQRAIVSACCSPSTT